MPVSLELPSAGSDSEIKPVNESKNESFLKRIEEIGGNLEYLDSTGVYYPFDYRIIDSLYGFRNTSEGKKIITEKGHVLGNILSAINREKELGYFAPSKENNEIIQILEELTRKKDEEKEIATRNQ